MSKECPNYLSEEPQLVQTNVLTPMAKSHLDILTQPPNFDTNRNLMCGCSVGVNTYLAGGGFRGGTGKIVPGRVIKTAWNTAKRVNNKPAHTHTLNTGN